jgi:thiosulfate/3-mercaptopyruvate sulfurtransferase
MSDSLKINKPLISVNWLHQNIEATNLIVLNGTLPKVTLQKELAEIDDSQIPNARFFDIKKVFSIQGAQFPNTALEPKNFESKARALGINKDSCIVVYDEHGIYSAPRVWWLFKTMGFDNVAVLDGGLPAWKEARYAVEEKQEHVVNTGSFKVHYNSDLLIHSTAVLNSLNDSTKQLLDARSSARFYATQPEPRAEIRSGHIPNSKSLPYSSLLSGLELKSKKELQMLFKEVNSENKELIFSCGSGITACILALGAAIARYEKLAVYDGSWAEWGSLQHLPIEK